MPEQKWLTRYESVKERLRCKTDLDSYFSKNQIGEMPVDCINIGTVHLPTGEVFACDPLVELEDAPSYLQKAPVGRYPVEICVVPSKRYGDRYACVRVKISNRKPVVYEMGMTGKENLEEELQDGDFFGFGVDAGMACIADKKAQQAYWDYWQKRCEQEEDIDPYNDLFCDVLEESFAENPTYQREGGDWANWTVPETDCNIPIFASGWGDGEYPCYFGYDEQNNLCAIYLWLIDIEQEYAESEE